MLEDQQPWNLDRLVRVALTCGMVAGLLWLLAYLGPVLVPFIIAFLLAYLLNPLVCLVQRKVQNRTAAVLVTLSGAAVTGIGLLWVTITLLVGQAVHAVNILKEMAVNGQYADRALEWLPLSVVERIQAYGDSWTDIGTLLQDEEFMKVLQSKPVADAASWLFAQNTALVSQLGGILAAIMGLTVIVLYLIFLLIDYDWFRSSWQKWIPEVHREPTLNFLGEFDAVMNRHFRAQAVVSMLTGLLFAIGFSVMGLPLAIMMGVMMGALNMVPYLQLAGLIPVGIMGLIMVVDKSMSIVEVSVWILSITAVVQVIQDAILVPRIMGKAFGLRPVIILLAIMIWGQLLGLLGLVIALPATCLFAAWYRRLVLHDVKE